MAHAPIYLKSRIDMPMAWRGYLFWNRRYASEREFATRVEATVNGKEYSIALMSMPTEKDMLALEKIVEAEDVEMLRHLGNISSLNPDDTLEFTDETGGTETYGAGDLKHIAVTYPSLWRDVCNPLLYSDFDIFERRGFLWLASRAEIDSRAAFLVRVAPNLGRYHGSLDDMTLSWSPWNPETGEYDRWGPTVTVGQAYGAVCRKGMKDGGLTLPEESSMGIDWLDVGKRLCALGCLESHPEDFFWETRAQLMEHPIPQLLTVNASSARSYLNNTAMRDRMATFKRFLALVEVEPGSARIFDCRSLAGKTKIDVALNRLSWLPHCAPSGERVIPLSGTDGATACAVMRKEADSAMYDIAFEERDMETPAWAKVGHPEIPGRDARPKTDEKHFEIEGMKL